MTQNQIIMVNNILAYNKNRLNIVKAIEVLIKRAMITASRWEFYIQKEDMKPLSQSYIITTRNEALRLVSKYGNVASYLYLRLIKYDTLDM